jgi:hypothetical protein
MRLVVAAGRRRRGVREGILIALPAIKQRTIKKSEDNRCLEDLTDGAS